jgi:hypothetical protein
MDDIDVKLISENNLKLPNYTNYHATHPAGTARSGTAIIIKNSIKHHQKTL